MPMGCNKDEILGAVLAEGTPSPQPTRPDTMQAWQDIEFASHIAFLEIIQSAP
jgi:hypothetical protein